MASAPYCQGAELFSRSCQAVVPQVHEIESAPGGLAASASAVPPG